MFKKLLAFLLVLSMLTGVALVAASCGGKGNDKKDPPACEHVDADDNGKCDECGEDFTDGCDNHVDADDNGVCDVDGCGEDFTDGNETNTHTVTLVDENGDPAVGVPVSVVITGNTATEFVYTDENGQAVVEVEDSVKRSEVVFGENIVGYRVPNDANLKFGFDEYEITIELTKLYLYTVQVVDTEGSAIEGVFVQICYGSTCIAASVGTDAEGYYSLYIPYYDGEPKAKITELPEGYESYVPTVEPVEDGYIYFEAGEDELVIVLAEA